MITRSCIPDDTDIFPNPVLPFITINPNQPLAPCPKYVSLVNLNVPAPYRTLLVTERRESLQNNTLSFFVLPGLERVFVMLIYTTHHPKRMT